MAATAAMIETADPPGAASSGKESLQASILRLKAEQSAARVQKQAIAKSLRNAQKRAARLKKRARMLSDGDLVEVLKMRDPSQKEVASGVAGTAGVATSGEASSSTASNSP